MTCDEPLPDWLLVQLNLLGVVQKHQPEQPEPKVEADFTFRETNLDSDGEPDF